MKMVIVALAVVALLAGCGQPKATATSFVGTWHPYPPSRAQLQAAKAQGVTWAPETLVIVQNPVGYLVTYVLPASANLTPSEDVSHQQLFRKGNELKGSEGKLYGPGSPVGWIIVDYVRDGVLEYRATDFNGKLGKPTQLYRVSPSTAIPSPSPFD